MGVELDLINLGLFLICAYYQNMPNLHHLYFPSPNDLTSLPSQLSESLQSITLFIILSTDYLILTCLFSAEYTIKQLCRESCQKVTCDHDVDVCLDLVRS